MNEREIYIGALEKPSAAERAAFLDGACGGDEATRRRLEALLREQAELGDFLESPPRALVPGADPTIPHATSQDPGAVIGPYRLLEPIGEGGMGVVYMAEQVHPVRRRVALKLIKVGMDTRQVLARFEAERQALAMMDHPNIAKVHDAGATDAGRPYFVMELVKGIPITDYCDGACLSIPERLGLFVQVCRAVQHAHQKGVIHRDLKPSNILVTLIDGAAVPKVIDFGIAKTTGGPLTDRTAFTGFAQLVGTPLYMSPEQAALSGVDVDTRSDVYALGVLLYELLTGTTPIDRKALGRAAYDEVRRIIREQETPTPSTRLATLGATLVTVSANRQSDARALGHAVRGELDWIVMRALEKDRTRRYETASAFAADVTRHLTDQPVEACPPSAWYRSRKFARRNRAALTTAVLSTLALVAGTAISAWQAIRATHAEAKASAHAEDTQLVVQSLINDVIGAAAPAEARGEPIRVIELLRTAESTLPARFHGRPRAEVAFRRALAEAYSGLAYHEDAERQIGRAVSLQTQLLGVEHPETLATLAVQVEVLRDLGIGRLAKRKEAIQLGRRLVEARRRVLGPDHLESMEAQTLLGRACKEYGDFAEACKLLEPTLAAQVRLLGPEHPATLVTLHSLGEVRHDLGHLATAETLLARAVAGQRHVYGPGHLETLKGLTNLALVVRDRGRNDEAVTLLREVVSGRRAIHGTPYFHGARGLCGLYVDALRDQGSSAAIRELCEGWLRELLEMPPEPDERIRKLKMVLESCLAYWLGTLPEGVRFDAGLAERAAERAAEQGDDVRDSNWTRLGVVLLRLGDTQRAERAVRTAMQRHGGGDRFDRLALALIHARRGESAQARAWFDRAEGGDDTHMAPGVGCADVRAEVASLLGVALRGRQGQGRGSRTSRDEARATPVVTPSRNDVGSRPPPNP